MTRLEIAEKLLINLKKAMEKLHKNKKLNAVEWDRQYCELFEAILNQEIYISKLKGEECSQ